MIKSALLVSQTVKIIRIFETVQWLFKMISVYQLLWASPVPYYHDTCVSLSPLQLIHRLSASPSLFVLVKGNCDSNSHKTLLADCLFTFLTFPLFFPLWHKVDPTEKKIEFQTLSICNFLSFLRIQYPTFYQALLACKFRVFSTSVAAQCISQILYNALSRAA